MGINIMDGLIIGKTISSAESQLMEIEQKYIKNNINPIQKRRYEIIFDNFHRWRAVSASHPAKIRGYKPQVIYLDFFVTDEEILNNIKYLEQTIPNFELYYFY